jgi:hypothetical protein
MPLSHRGATHPVFCRALYGEILSFRGDRAIAEVLEEGLSEGKLRALERELRQAPSKNFLRVLL